VIARGADRVAWRIRGVEVKGTFFARLRYCPVAIVLLLSLIEPLTIIVLVYCSNTAYSVIGSRLLYY
jgi:hypothetical protein